MLKNLTRREQIVIIISLSILCSGIFYFQLYQPLLTEKETLENNISSLHLEYLQKVNQVKRKLPEINRTKSELEEEYNRIIQQFPRQKEISTFLVEINDLANQQGIYLEYFAPRNMQNKGDFYELPINISFFTNFTSLVSFVYALEHSAKKIDIVNFDVRVVNKSADTALSLQVDMTLKIYIVKE